MSYQRLQILYHTQSRIRIDLSHRHHVRQRGPKASDVSYTLIVAV